MKMSEFQKKGDILVVDDVIDNVRLLADMLTENGYEVRQILSGKQALEVIKYDPPELILLDIMMPEMDGFQVCEAIKKNPETKEIPIIFISAKDGIFDKIKAFEIGGVDYITKPFFLPEVLCRVQTHLMLYRNKELLTKEINQKQKIQEKLEKANQQLQKIANLDGLTNIANRRFFDEYLTKEWNRLKRENLPLSLIMIDVDYFKLYNDTYGHLAGDDCLKKIALIFDQSIKRAADLAARYGGEEFIIILPNTPSQGAERIAKNIQKKIANLAITHESSLISHQVTLSLGVATVIPNSKVTPADLIHKADQALYQAKLDGRNRIIIDSE